MFRNSAHALVQAIKDELDREDKFPLHKAINISCRSSVRENGMKYCTVQIECKAGCGYLIQAFGDEADMLQEKAMVFKKILDKGIQDGSECLLLLFPGLSE